jgi:transcriptional regulator with XRE-family HTH domain
MPGSENNVVNKRMEIIKRITEARTAKGITQSALAAQLGVNRSNISRLESGEHNPTLDFLLRVASELDVEIDLTAQGKASDEILTSAYELRLFNDTLLTFTLEEKGIEGLTTRIVKVNNDNSKLFPLNMALTNEDVLKWIQRRVIPKNRTFVDKILKSLGLSVGNTKGIIDVCKGLSLNDSYWVVPVGFDGTWEQYNLYENPFSEILSLVAYTGQGASQKAFTTSPELTTNGMLPKAWRFFEKEGIYLYKGGSSGAANTGNEPYSEFYACQIAEAMGLNAVHYDLEKWKGILASKCKLFTDIDTAFVSIGRIVPTGGLKACMDYYDSLGEDFGDNIRSMLVFDTVIYNEDRHFGNFGILRDSHSGVIISPAPLFDHGVSLFNYAMSSDIADLDAYAKTRYPAYGNVSFESIVSEVGGKLQAKQLRSLIGFKFRRHKSINWEEERLTAIEKHIQKRVRKLLGLIG